MSQKMPFFKFDTDSWLTGKIQLLTATEKGIFIDLVSRIWKENGFLKNDEILHRLIRVEKGTLSEALQAFFDLGIMTEKDGFLSVKFIDEQISDIENYKKKQSEFGSKGGRPKKGTKANKKEDIRNKREEIKEKNTLMCIPKEKNSEPLFSYPTTEEEIIEIARSSRCGTLGVYCTPEEARNYLNDRIRKDWIPNGQHKQIPVSAVGNDLMIWLANVEHRVKKEQQQNGTGYKHFSNKPEDYGDDDDSAKV